MKPSSSAVSWVGALEKLNQQVHAVQKGGSTQGLVGSLNELLVQIEQLSPNEAPVDAEISPLREGGLYHQLGSLLRRFHDQLSGLEEIIPHDLTGLNSADISSMAGHLKHVLDLTENAANKTMDLAEESLDAFGQESTGLNEVQRELQALLNEKCLTKRATKKVATLLQHTKKIEKQNESHQERLNHILLAQSYQDLSGQLIQKLLGLVESLEKDLLSLVQQFGQPQRPIAMDPLLQGPLSADNEQRQEQTDVDSLLGQFGF